MLCKTRKNKIKYFVRAIFLTNQIFLLILILLFLFFDITYVSVRTIFFEWTALNTTSIPFLLLYNYSNCLLYYYSLFILTQVMFGDMFMMSADTNKGISEGKATLLSTLYSIDANDKEKTDRVGTGTLLCFLSLLCLFFLCHLHLLNTMLTIELLFLLIFPCLSHYTYCISQQNHLYILILDFNYI